MIHIPYQKCHSVTWSRTARHPLVEAWPSIQCNLCSHSQCSCSRSSVYWDTQQKQKHKGQEWEERMLPFGLDLDDFIPQRLPCDILWNWMKGKQTLRSLKFELAYFERKHCFTPFFNVWEIQQKWCHLSKNNRTINSLLVTSHGYPNTIM
jgi:hypothetical protein